MSAKLSLIWFCIPLPRPTITMTAAMPMMMPSMVRKVRILLPRMFLTARENASVSLIAPPPFPPFRA